MKKALMIVAVAACSAPLGRAGTIVLFDNLQGGYTNSGWVIDFSQSVANPFVASQNAVLTEVVLALRPVTDLYQQTFYNISIREANGSVPGSTVLYSWTNVAGAGLNVLTFASDVPVVAGGSYFVQVDPANRGLQGVWFWANPPDTGPFAFSFFQTWYAHEGYRGGMTVKAFVPDGGGDPDVPVVPGPMAALPFALGLLLRRRRR
ncbi:MAG: hypothetical protein N2109_08800 [Fimbriimonadales bacterium]|nr:hypothetical protein [Fimbriimonadales bacterium]